MHQQRLLGPDDERQLHGARLLRLERDHGVVHPVGVLRAPATSSACTAVAGCTWISSLSTCVGSEGFLHDYGKSPANIEPPNCAMDVRLDTKVTACVGSSSCTISAADNVMGTGANPANGSTLPLASLPAGGGAPNLYPTDPCPSLGKSMAMQVTCGACTGTVAAYTDLTDAPTGGGQENQANYFGSLGMEFTVNSSIEITTLGAYDPPTASYPNGVNITVAIYDTATQQIVTNSGGSQLKTIVTAGTPVATGTYDRFINLASSFTLGSGTYMVVAWGYNLQTPKFNDFNSYGAAGGANTENTGSGLIFVRRQRVLRQRRTAPPAPTPAIDFPTTVDTGPANRWLRSAGTFQFEATPPKASAPSAAASLHAPATTARAPATAAASPTSAKIPSASGARSPTTPTRTRRKSRIRTTPERWACSSR